jgi:glycosyltransferase involved in cell wall biosynthesis
MKRVLFLVPISFHNNVAHAGGKVVNYYFNRFATDADFTTSLAYTADDDTDYALMVKQYPDIKIFSGFKKKKPVERLIDGFQFRVLFPFLKKISPRYYITNRFLGNRILSILKDVKQSGMYPDVIIFEFTSVIFWIEEIKKIFPDSITIASCHDVTYQSVERSLKKTGSFGAFGQYYYHKFKKLELSILKQFDLLIFLNAKDKALIEKEDINVKKEIIAPFYDKYTITNTVKKDYIVFFGAMYRAENIDAAQWFLKNVWIDLDKYFNGAVKYVIVGGGMNDENKRSFTNYNNVIVTGFIKEPEAIFSRAACFVAPLRLGAGIKIKVLEAMYAGIPVFTNSVGIEGIPAVDGKDYIYCEGAHDYIDQIKTLLQDSHKWQSVSQNAKLVISNNFDVDNSYNLYRSTILKYFN